MSHEHTGYTLVLSFEGLFSELAEEKAFVYGVEFGQLLQRMRTETYIEETFNSENRRIIQRAAAAYGWEFDWKPSGTRGWDYVTLTKGAPLEQPNPMGLRVVTLRPEAKP